MPVAQFTKKAIMETFINMLEKKPLDKITVKDIVDACEINRGTFYYYYENIDRLIEDIFETELQAVVSQHKTYDSWQEALLEGTQVAKQNKRQLYHALRALNEPELDNYVVKTTRHLMSDFVDQQADGLIVPDEDKKYIVDFYTCAIHGLIKRWLADGMKENPEDYINGIGRLFDGSIRRALEKADKDAVHRL